MTRNPDATIYVYRHRETGTITALYSDDACAMNCRPDYEHVATLEPRMWILINRANGVAVLGTYHAQHQWTHWQGLPKFPEEHQ